MPVLNPVKRGQLIMAGYDPDKMDELVPIEPLTQVETQAQAEPPKEQQTGPIESAVGNALLGLPSTAFSLGAASLGARAGAAIPVPYLPAKAALTIGGGLLGGIAGGVGGKYLQDYVVDKYFPESLAERYKNFLKASQEEHPVASRVGNVASSLAFLKPSPEALKSAAGLITTPLTRGVNAITKEQVANAANVAIGATAPTVASLVQGGNPLEEFKQHPILTALEAVAGGAINDPNRFGRKLLRMQPSVKPENLEAGLEERIRNSEPIKPVTRGPIALLTEGDKPTTYSVSPEGVVVNEQTGQKIPDTTTPTSLELLEKAKADNLAAQEELKAETARVQAETEAMKRALAQTPNLPEEAGFALPPKAIEASAQTPSPKDVLYTPERTEPVRLKANTPSEIPISPKPVVEPSPKDLLYQQENADKSRLAPIVEGLQAKDLPVTPTVAWSDYFKSLAKKRNLKVDDTGRIFDAKGREVSGEAVLRKELEEALVRINPNKAQLDTLPHEFFHPFFEDLKQLGDTRDLALYNRAQRVMKESPEYQTWAKDRETKGLNANPTEFLTQLVGEDSIRRLLNTDNTGKIKNWFRDFWTYQKQKFGRGSEGDIARVMSNKLINDPAFSERYGGQKLDITPGITEQKKENESVKTQEESPFAAIAKEEAAKVPTAKPTTPPEEPSTPTPYIPKFLQSVNDKIRALGTPNASALADSIQNFYEGYKFNRGKLEGKLMDAIYKTAGVNVSDVLKKGNLREYVEQDSPILRSTYNKLLKIRETGNQNSVKFTPEEQKLVGPIRDMLNNVRREVANRPSMREVGDVDPNYIPHIMNNEVIETILKNRETPEAKQYIKDFTDYYTERMGKKKAVETLNAILDSYDSRLTDIASKYGPIDKAQGIGLPKSWIEPNLIKAMTRYTDRVARRFAYHDAIQTNPKALAGLEQHKGDENVKTIVADITGNAPGGDTTFKALEGIARAGALGTLTGARDVTAALTQVWQHQQNPMQAIRTGAKALASLNKYISDGVANGRIRHNINSLEWGETISILKRASDILTDISGRNFLERISRGYTTGVGELTTLEFLEQYNKGSLSTQGREWFNKFGRDTNWKSGKLTNEELLKIAGRVTDSAQGSYDYTGLPKYTREGAVSPLMSLARWNVEKANNYMKNVIHPMRQGNFTPFFMSTIGAVITGSAVNALTEYVTGRKEKTATVKELKTAYEEGEDIKLPLLYKALGIASAAGYAGLLSDVAKSIMDRQYAKVKPRWYNNLAFDAAHNISTTILNAADAIKEEGLTPELAGDIASKVLLDHFQALRLIYNHLGEDRVKEIEQSNKLRDLRSFNLLSGREVSDLTSSDYEKKFTGQKLKDFKQSEDPEEIMRLLPEILKTAVEKAKDSPELLKKELLRIKLNSYQTMPNPESMPDSFAKYLIFLQKTQGEEAAAKRFEDYVRRNMLNEVKSSLVP